MFLLTQGATQLEPLRQYIKINQSVSNDKNDTTTTAATATTTTTPAAVAAAATAITLTTTNSAAATTTTITTTTAAAAAAASTTTTMEFRERFQRLEAHYNLKKKMQRASTHNLQICGL